MPSQSEFLWYIPNEMQGGHRGEPTGAEHNSLDTLTAHARALDDHGWGGALIGAGWGRPDRSKQPTRAGRAPLWMKMMALRAGVPDPGHG